MRRHLVVIGFAAVSLTAAACSGGGDSSGDETSSPSTSTSTSSSTSPSASATPTQSFPDAKATITPRLLPAIASSGDKPEPSDDAAHVVVAKFAPVQAGREVSLQQSVKGSWKDVDAQEEPKSGLVGFSVDDPKAGALRVVAPKVGGSPQVIATLKDDQMAGGLVDSSFDDEFDGDSLSDEWHSVEKEYNPTALRTCSKSSDDSAIVKDGRLDLTVQDDPDTDELCEGKKRDGTKLGEFAYRLNGHITTSQTFTFTYGVAAARMKFPEGRGQHGAFWLWPKGELDKTAGPDEAGAEIDIAEWFGSTKTKSDLRTFAYWRPEGEDKLEKVGGPIPDLDSYLASKDDEWYDAYHTFALEWTPKTYTFLIDGQVVLTTDKGISGVPEYLRLSLEASDYELKYAPDAKDLPHSMAVDWVRVWPLAS